MMAGPLGTCTNEPEIDAGTMCLQESLTPGPTCGFGNFERPSDLTALDEVLRAARDELATVAAQIIHDAPVRAAYIREVEKGIADIRDRYVSGSIPTIEEAAAEANQFRNMALKLMRVRTTPLGLVIAKNLKEEGLTLNELI